MRAITRQLIVAENMSMALSPEDRGLAHQIEPSSSRDADGLSTASTDSGNESAESLSVSAFLRHSLLDFVPPSWPTGRRGFVSEEISPQSSGKSIESQPLIVKEVEEQPNESTPPKDCLTVREGWKSTQLLKTDFVASKASLVSTSSSLLCRICHTECSTTRDPLVSPCRCSGSLLYVHRSCLVHWLELSTKKMVPSPRCELCAYNYRRSHCLNLSSIHLPSISGRDRILNMLFVVVFIIMVVCAFLSIHFLQLSEQYHSTLRGYRIVSSSLSDDDVTVVICSVLFFAAFFVAVFTQYRAEASLFRLIFRCWVINRNWTIRNYDISDDPEMLAHRQAREARIVIDQSNKDTRPSSPKVEDMIAITSLQLPIPVLDGR